MYPNHYQLALQEQQKKIAAGFKFMIKAGHKILENGISIQHKDSFEFFTFSLANHDVKRTQMRALVPRQN